MENQLFELARSRRSIRRYRQCRISEEIIDSIIDVGLMAPTSFGKDAVEFITVRVPQMIKSIASCKSLGGKQIIGADTVIVVLVKRPHDGSDEFWIENGSVASSYILLAAEQYGLGACWVQIRNRFGNYGTSDQEIRNLLKVPEGYEVLNLIALGDKGEIKQSYNDIAQRRKRHHKEIF